MVTPNINADDSQNSRETKNTVAADFIAEATDCYLAHVEGGQSIRSIATGNGLHPSTILRRIRKIEAKRDDPIVDSFLSVAAELMPAKSESTEGDQCMTSQTKSVDLSEVNQTQKEEIRILRRLCETGAFLAVASDLENAVVFRNESGGAQTRIAVTGSKLAAAMILKDWLRCSKRGRVACYKIAPAGRAALKRKLAVEGQKSEKTTGFSEAPSAFSEQHKEWGERSVSESDSPQPRKLRVNLSESPLTTLARKKDKSGKPFLSPELLAAGEQLREDFELAQMGPRIAQNWERFLTAGDRRNYAPSAGGGNVSAQRRLSDALTALGPGLGDIVMRCCCFLEGMELAEKRMGWSARSGKIVLRIALQRLHLHYQNRADCMRKIG
ncbi:MAG: helix-turn-helix domain-containing protein [Rhodobacteraceae bacterium]|nr:helix-turn-helix domain-containing protein [Paracoccaceae bacterium]